MYAHFYKGFRTSWVHITRSSNIAECKGEEIATYTVAGKREARKIALAQGATPWNF